MPDQDPYNHEQYIPEEDSYYALPTVQKSPVQPMYFNRNVNTLLKDDSPMARIKQIAASVAWSVIEIPVCTVKSIFKR